MDYFVISITALIVSTLTLFSGFGLGTLLMPAFALFFPIPVAVAATALVHLANNIFKVFLVGRQADRRVVLKFAIPAALAAFVGAWLLEVISGAAPLFAYALGERTAEITPVKLIIGALIVGFALLELAPRFESLAFNPRYIPLGGVLSGFFGGLSGHQGALRSAFLIRAGLSKEAFIGTMVVSAVVVDVARLLVYGATFSGFSGTFVSRGGASGWALVGAGIVAAFAGSMLGARLVKKVTMKTIRLIVGVMLLALGIALSAGVI
ncbi:MAG TPA: sulfite exporter TauE/SafE family protein [Kiritimatiellia bacterium]|nr:sulfite exporter TauE/SafE family protein [Kiritimatiellia bacterium]HMP00297.1 sulfite exporter TauE/SafE family protein [Kiritimatiellia bacterium]HMP97634.1 sulfite exporter TauE/SafE family protein [Kiritimatiellia bacterium]